jgi:hypothetical protein
MVDIRASMLVMATSVVRELGIMHLVSKHETYKTTSEMVTQAFGRITNILVTMGRVVCQMVFLVVDTNNYDLLLGLDFLMKIGAVVDVENGVIQIRNGPSVVVEVLPFNVVNMLQLVMKTKEEDLYKLDNLSLENLHMKEVKTHSFQFFGFNDCCDDFLSEDEMNESKNNANDNPKRILPLEVDLIEELSNHGMNQVLDEETPMHIFNLALHEQ